MDRLEEEYLEHNVRNLMSRADFWILCSHVALKDGQRRSGRRKMLKSNYEFVCIKWVLYSGSSKWIHSVIGQLRVL